MRKGEFDSHYPIVPNRPNEPETTTNNATKRMTDLDLQPRANTHSLPFGRLHYRSNVEAKAFEEFLETFTTIATNYGGYSFFVSS